MSQQEIECSTYCKVIELNNEKKQKIQNRITIDQIPNKELTNCYCQLSKDPKQKKCQSMAKCKYQLTNELSQLPDITLYSYFNEISNSDNSIEATAYKKTIHFLRDFNSMKDQNDEFRLKLKLINKDQITDDKDKDYEPFEETYPKLAIELNESPQDFKNDGFIKIVICLQDQIDQILEGEETFFFFFFKQGLDCSIQKSIQFLQRANYREIQCNQSQSSTSVSKIKSDTYKISLISIQKTKLDFLSQKKENLQFLNFYLDECQSQTQNNINTTNNINYNIPIEHSLESLKVALKYFVKEKLKEFKPHIIIFYFEISSILIKDPQIFYKFVKFFHKISQGKLIIIPQIDPQMQQNKSEIIQQYINCTNNCFLGCLKNQHTQKLNQSSIIQYYELLYPFFIETNNQLKKQYYRNQLKSLQIQQQKIIEKQSRQNLHREFPIIDKDGNLILLDLDQEFDITKIQYFVEYNQNGEYDGYIILIEQKRIQIIYFQEQNNLNQSKNIKLQIVKKQQFSLPQNYNGVYYFDTEQNALIYFFGYTQVGEFSSDIQFLEITNQLTEWQIVKYQQYKKKVEDGTYTDFQQIINLIKYRSQFSVTKNRIDGFKSQDKNSYVCIGGSYQSEECNYGCIIQEVVIEFKQKVYNTKIAEKSKIDKFYKECPNPLLIKMNDAFVLYFEKNGIYNINNSNPSITKLCFWKSRQHLIQNIKINLKDTKTSHWFMQFHQQLSSNQQNIRMCQVEQSVENLLRFRILIEEQSVQKQPQYIENKLTLRKFYILTISFFSLKNEILLDCKQFQVNSHFQLKTIHDLQREERQEFYQNSVENQKNTFIFYYKEYDYQYILCYIDETKKVQFKRFVFYDPKTQDNDDFRDYQELIYQDWSFSKLYIIRKQITLNECQLRIYECHHINFLDIKDSEDDILHQVTIRQIYMISDFKSTYQLIGFHIEIKNDDSFDGIVLTNKNYYQIVNQKKTITHTQQKHTKPLNVNSQQKFYFLKFKSSYYLFYKRLQFQQANVNKVSQNIIEIKYLFLDSNFQVLAANTILCSLNEPLPIFGPLDGLINIIKSQENLMDIQILINQNTLIFKSSIICRINQETNQLDQLNVNSQIPSKNEGFNMFPLIQSNRKKGDYIVKQSKDHSKICCE